jgi:hypothetical protein
VRPEGLGKWVCEPKKFDTSFLDNELTHGGEFVSLTRQRPSPLRTIPGTHFC